MGAPAGLPEDDEREPPGTVQDRLGARGDTTPPARRASRGCGCRADHDRPCVICSTCRSYYAILCQARTVLLRRRQTMRASTAAPPADGGSTRCKQVGTKRVPTPAQARR